MNKLIILCIPCIIFSHPIWTYRYTSPGNNEDIANTIIYGYQDTIYVGGGTCIGSTVYMTVVSLTAAGDTNWTSRIIPGTIRRIVMDDFGDTYICSSNWTFFIASLNPNGDTNWTYSNQANGESGATDLVYGSDSNLYAAGYLNFGGDNLWDYTVISLSRSGTERWIRTYNGGTWCYDACISICYGLNGSIYSAGYMQPTQTSQNFIVMSHNRFGGLNWTRSWNSGFARSVVYGSDGNIYAAGSQGYYPNYTDLTLKRFSSSGGRIWSTTYGGSGLVDDLANSVACGDDSNIYVAGYLTSLSTGKNFAVLCYSPDSTFKWGYLYQDAGESEARSIVCGLDGKIYAGGYITGCSTNNRDCMIACFTPSGDTEWVYTYNGPGNGNDEINQIIYGPDNMLYAAGYTTGENTGKDLTVFCFNALAIEENKNQPDNSPAPFTVHPNPCFNTYVIKMNLPDLQQLSSLYMYDATGRLVSTIWHDRKITAPSYTHHIPRNLTAGVYYLVLESEKEKSVQEVTVIR